MADLPREPKGHHLEDLAAAYFASRGCFVELGVTERDPGDILELDVLWTDYLSKSAQPVPVEAKSGDFGIGDVFKFFGWTRYLGLPPGQFLYAATPRDEATLVRVFKKLEIVPVQASSEEQLSDRLAVLELPKPATDCVVALWRYSFWIQRTLFTALNRTVGRGVLTETGPVAKRYHRLINDALFFEPDPRDRFERLYEAHQEHPKLAAAVACETAGKKVDLSDPSRTDLFNEALYRGKHFHVQTCLHLAHRARLYVLKAAVDLSLGMKSGRLQDERERLKIGDRTFVATIDKRLTPAFSSAMKEYEKLPWYPRLPTFWQTFLWTWGGFILTDRADEEYAALAEETGVPVEEVPKALEAFDRFFPVDGGWLRNVKGSSRRVVSLMPAVLRGIGALRRLWMHGKKHYDEMGYSDLTANHLGTDHDSGVDLLDWSSRA